jgi:N-acyl homoserine lactone hydrolase
MNDSIGVSRSEPGAPGPVSSVSVLSTGTVQIRPEHPYGSRKPMYLWLVTSRRWTPPRPINVYVIEHERGLVLFDTGQDRASVTDGAHFPGGFTRIAYNRLARFDIGEKETLTAQLATLGYGPGDVGTAILSPLHQDHIGGLPELTGARLLVSAGEWAEAAASSSTAPGRYSPWPRGSPALSSCRPTTREPPSGCSIAGLRTAAHEGRITRRAREHSGTWR